MMAKKQRKLIRDKELSGLMRRIRRIVGEDVRIIFKTVKGGSRLVGTYNPDNDDYDDSEPDFDYNNPDGRFEKKYPKLQGRKKELNKPVYFG